MFIAKNKQYKKMDGVLDRLFEDLESVFSKEFHGYIVKISQVKKSFYVLVWKPRGEILGRDKKLLFKKVEEISKNIYHNYARNCSRLRYSFFPYSNVVRSDYHYHFLVIRKEYRARWMFFIMAAVFLVLKLKTSFVFIFACIFTMLSRKKNP